ncbi:MAG: rhomboid family intramembrane serine protease [Deltaproteobacteria bacterium]|nr:rhomboid family intramembrane serine protease [Deltaproteobacteria bacterium]
MIPIRDTISSKNYPVVNNVLIGVNLFVYLAGLFHGSGLSRFDYIYGLVPARYSIPQIASYFSFGQQALSLVSFMFLHGGFWHLLGNMWTLYIFGDNVEDRLGPLRYLLFYLICGMASGMTHLILNLHSNIPVIGASGAIAGVMGAYLLLHPYSKILTLIPIIFIPWFVEIPAFFFLGFWFFMQFLQATGGDSAASGIAWWAHVGGFLFGMLFLKVFLCLPGAGDTHGISRITARKKTNTLQVIRPVGFENDPTLYGTIIITPYEAISGAYKMVNISWGFYKKLFRVVVPSGIKDGGLLRLKGEGKKNTDGKTGDLLLKVTIQEY